MSQKEDQLSSVPKEAESNDADVALEESRQSRLTPMERWQQEQAERERNVSEAAARLEAAPGPETRTESKSSQGRFAVPIPKGQEPDPEDYDARASIVSISQLQEALKVEEKRRSALEQLGQQKPGELYKSLKEKFEPTVTVRPVLKPSLKHPSEVAASTAAPQHPVPVEIEQEVPAVPRNRFVPKGYGNMAAGRPASIASSERVEGDGPVYPKYFHSRRIKKGTTSKPWLENKSSQDRWPAIIMSVSLLLGLAIIFAEVWSGLQSVQEHVYCPVLMEDFSDGLSNDVWSKEVEVGGYGGVSLISHHTDENVFVQNGVLVIKPTLQDQDLMTKNNVINLTRSGLCTTTGWMNCITSTNTTNGTVVNPVKSARINTKKGATIKYGKIEVVAKMPKGDWLWPAVWMLPVKDTYGDWPASGEIDIVESRGNNFSYPEGGNNIVSSTLHWGPDPDNDGWWRNNNKRKALHAAWGDGWHTFGLEWSEKYLFTYVDSRLLQVMYVKFDKPFWKRGHFPPADSNGTNLIDPCSQTARDSTPFDQEFYLILNVAVGGTNGWFDDAEAGKPWVDASPSARRDFWQARDQWYPTWKEPGAGQMEVKSVKMWQQQGYNGFLSKRMPSISFSIDWQFSLSCGRTAENVPVIAEESRPQTALLDTKEVLLSPATLDLQRRIRQRARGGGIRKGLDRSCAERERERLADAESLRLLETATAKAEISKRNNRESLEVLLDRTMKDKTTARPTFLTTPEQTSFWPRDRPFHRKRSSPLTDAAPFSTPSSVEREIKAGLAKAKHESIPSHASSVSPTSSLKRKLDRDGLNGEFEAYLQSTTSSGHTSSVEPRKQRSTSFSARLESSKESKPRDASVKQMDSAYIQQQASSVFVAMEQARRAGDGDDLTEQSPRVSSGKSSEKSWVTSPVSSTENLPKIIVTTVDEDDDCADEVEKGAMEEAANGGDEQVSVADGEAFEDEKEDEEVYVLAPSSAKSLEGEDGWEVVDGVE